MTVSYARLPARTTGFGGDGGPALKANLEGPSGLGFLPNGELIVSDFTNNRLRRVGFLFPGSAEASDLLIASEDGSEVYRFDSSGKHLSTIHALTGGVLYSFSYDSQGRLTGVTDGNGNVTSIQRNGAIPTAIVGPFGQTTPLGVDGNGFLTSITNPASETVQLVHQSDGLLTSMRTPKNEIYNYSYDPATGFLLTDADPAGGSQTLARTILTPSATLRDGFKVSDTTALGRTKSYQTENQKNGERKETSTATDGTQSVMTFGLTAAWTRPLQRALLSKSTESADPRWGMLAPVGASGELKDAQREDSHDHRSHHRHPDGPGESLFAHPTDQDSHTQRSYVHRRIQCGEQNNSPARAPRAALARQLSTPWAEQWPINSADSRPPR